MNDGKLNIVNVENENSTINGILDGLTIIRVYSDNTIYVKKEVGHLTIIASVKKLLKDKVITKAGKLPIQKIVKTKPESNKRKTNKDK